MKTSPTSRTLALLRKQGFACQVVERWNQFAKVRQDLFGFIDIVAMDGTSIYGVQATTATNRAARREKILDDPRSLIWQKSGGKILLITWSKKGGRDKRKVWTENVEEVS